MFPQDQAPKADDGIQSRDKYGFPGALTEYPWYAFFCVPVQDLNSVGDPDPNHQGEHHDVGRIEAQVSPSHEANNPKSSDSDGKKGQQHAT